MRVSLAFLMLLMSSCNSIDLNATDPLIKDVEQIPMKTITLIASSDEWAHGEVEGVCSSSSTKRCQMVGADPAVACSFECPENDEVTIAMPVTPSCGSTGLSVTPETTGIEDWIMDLDLNNGDKGYIIS